MLLLIQCMSIKCLFLHMHFYNFGIHMFGINQKFYACYMLLIY